MSDHFNPEAAAAITEMGCQLTLAAERMPESAAYACGVMAEFAIARNRAQVAAYLAEIERLTRADREKDGEK